MSAVPYRKIRANSVIFINDRAHSCSFVHGVSVGFLVGNCRRTAYGRQFMSVFEGEAEVTRAVDFQQRRRMVAEC